MFGGCIYKAGEKVPILPAAWTWAHQEPFPRMGQIKRLISAKESLCRSLFLFIATVPYLIPELQPTFSPTELALLLGCLSLIIKAFSQLWHITEWAGLVSETLVTAGSFRQVYGCESVGPSPANFQAIFSGVLIDPMGSCKALN